MTILQADQRELILPMLAGIQESPPWQTFMTSLVARTRAGRAFLVIQPAPGQKTPETFVQTFAGTGAGPDEPPEFGQMASLGLRGLSQLRPGRVYSLDEMLDFNDSDRLDWQRTCLDSSGVRYGRWLRVSAGVADAWFILTREREDFSASAVALLSSMAPHFAEALRVQVNLSEQQQRADLAQKTLAKLGIGQLVFDRSGYVLIADQHAETVLTIIDDVSSGRVGRRLGLPPEPMRRFEEAFADVSEGAGAVVATVALDASGENFLLLRWADLPANPPAATPAVVGIVRTPVTLNERTARAVISSIYGLSEREAALACGLVNGGKIVEVGADLRLTRETSRNYSKRIYEKTGTRSQVDLVSMLLRGLPPLA